MSHPARYSREVLALFAEILLHEWPDFMPRPILHDPFAGTGERLHEFCNHPDTYFTYTGTEIEEAFIEAPGIVHGDARDPLTYPPHTRTDDLWAAGWVIVTSAVYPNGMCDHHRPRDTSKRRNYRASKIAITGDPDAELDEGNAGRYGYRGTKRPEDGGTSKRREQYWAIHRAAIPHWETAEMVLVNVSDFKHSNGEVEPVVDDWAALLREFGWTDQTHHPVGTKRMRHGKNREQRVEHEVVIVGRR